MDAETTTELAVERTRLALERTLMGWIRTSVSLVTFGFALDKLLLVEGAQRAPVLVHGRTIYSIAMIVVGVLALIVGVAQQRAGLRALRRHSREMPRSFGLHVAAACALLAALAMISVLAS